MAFLTEPEPPRGVPLPVLPGIARIVAANPSVMTYHGTNTYLIQSPEGTIVLDPGPEDADHVAHILAATAGRVAAIVLTHTHRDHVGAVAALKAATSAPTHGFRRSADPAVFVPDVALDDGDAVLGMVAVHTPGHAADHLCYARPDGVLFSGDHVMSWNSTVVSPPGGNMADYFASLRRLLERDDAAYLSGHGPMLPEPRPLVRALLAHRQMREGAILSAIAARPSTPWELVDALYSQTEPRLRQAAHRNVVAHLEKLGTEGRAAADGETWRAG